MCKQKILFSFLTVAGVIGVVLSVGMLVTAIRFGEWGRVLLYCVTALVCIELTVISLMKLFQRKNRSE